MWLKELKIAVIEKDISQIENLLNNLPQEIDAKMAKEAVFLLKEATSYVESLKDDTQKSMIQMQKNITFLKATESPFSGKFDIIS